MGKKSWFQTIFLILAGAALVIAVLIFAGVLPGFKAKPVGQAGQITIWGPWLPSRVGKLIDELNRDNKEQFVLTYVAKGNNFDQELVEALAAGRGPDMVVMPHEYILKHWNKFFVLPFESLPLATYEQTFIDGSSLFMSNQGAVALPLAVDPLVLYYNRRLYNNANLITAPQSWEEMIKNQPVLTKVDQLNRVSQSALALGTFSNNNNAKDILSLLILQAGGSPISYNQGEYQVTLDSSFDNTLAPAPAAIDFFLLFANPAKSTYCWNKSLPEAKDSFLAETLANYLGLASERFDLEAKNPHLDLALATVPQLDQNRQSTFGRFYGLAVLKNTARSQAAWQAAFVLTNPTNIKRFAEAGGWEPVRRSLLASPDPADPWQAAIYRSTLSSQAWFDFAPVETAGILRQITERVASGQMDSSEAIAKASAEFKKLSRF